MALSLATLPKVEYCIPLWLRDEQVKAAIARQIPRIAPHHELRDAPCAVVCFGPSLNDTWEQLRDHKYIITCSGAHKFLVERGIIPTWHVEVDPRPYKVELIGPPRAPTEYLIASTCHADVFEHLKDMRTTLWHVFSNEDEALRILPHGEWALTGGSSVGLRAMTIARFLGFRHLDVFGMDGCDGPSGKHAASHPNQPKDRHSVEYGGETYYTTPSMLVCAQSTWHELDEMPDVVATFHGTGLVQAMAKDYTRTAPHPKGTIGFVKPELISAEYRGLNAQLHRSNPTYGAGGQKHAETVCRIAEKIGTRSILDYGSGKGLLAQAIPYPIWEYDPAVLGKEGAPRPADLVVCTDVLEHIEPEKLMFVLGDLQRCVLKVGYFVIHTGPAQKSYADGRNTHLIQRGESWWRKHLDRFFCVASVQAVGPMLYVIVGPRVGKRPILTRRSV